MRIQNADELKAAYAVPAALLHQAGIALDIVSADGHLCNCFTSTYGRYIKVLLA